MQRWWPWSPPSIGEDSGSLALVVFLIVRCFPQLKCVGCREPPSLGLVRFAVYVDLVPWIEANYVWKGCWLGPMVQMSKAAHGSKRAWQVRAGVGESSSFFAS